ncbi:sugar ABC transporter substrate-binding protein [Clostridia bacterium]|nr:sugar ABC transporter substrate-binding protein [Clostridia bacterium]
MKKILVMALTIALIAMCFVAPIASAAEAPTVITMLAPFYAEQPPKGTTGEEGNPVLEAVEALANVDLQITWAPQGDYVQKFNTVLASADLPDIIIVTSGLTTNQTYLDYAAQGIFWDLTDKIAERPLLRDELTTEYSRTITAVGGRNYLVPFVVASARVAMLYRADWLENLGMEPPTTVAEYYEMVKAFTENDPDGNGIKDTYGFAYIDDANKELNFAGLDTLAVANGAPNHWGYDAEGKILPYFMFDEYVDTLKLFKDMFDNGYMNNDFALIKGNDKHLPLGEGKAGSMFTSATNSAYPGGKYDALRDNITPTAEIARQYLFTLPSGEQVINSTLSMGGVGGLLITKASVKDEAKVDAILDFLEAVGDTENGGAKLVSIGVEDLHYTDNGDGTITITPEQHKLRVDDSSAEVFASIIPRRVVSANFGQPYTVQDLINLETVANESYAVPDYSVGKFDAEELSLDASLALIISDARVQFIMGQIDEAGFKAAVQEWVDQGGDILIEAVNAE